MSPQETRKCLKNSNIYHNKLQPKEEKKMYFMPRNESFRQINNQTK